MAQADARARVARAIDVDVATAAVAAGLRAAGVRAVLLKGPAVARVLYDSGELRPYADADLLVAPADGERAAAVLAGLGYEPLVGDEALRGHRPVHAHEWVRRGGASVDLHRTLPGATGDPEAVFAALARHTVEIGVAGEPVEALAPEAVCVQVALHAAHHGPRAGKALRDLERAVARVDEGTWGAAAALAGQLDATAAFAAGLRLAPAGASLADRLRLPRDAPVDVALKAAGAPPLAVGLDWLLRTPGVAAKLGILVRTVFPAPSALRLWRPRARRGTAGLAWAYVTHPFWLARHAVPSLLAMQRARREAR